MISENIKKNKGFRTGWSFSCRKRKTSAKTVLANARSGFAGMNYNFSKLKIFKSQHCVRFQLSKTEKVRILSSVKHEHDIDLANARVQLDQFRKRASETVYRRTILGCTRTCEGVRTQSGYFIDGRIMRKQEILFCQLKCR